MRGVYLPLALLEPACRRIISACAGFTARVIATAGFRGDHPRMRGVYGARARGNRRHEGSSPHARGLPDGGHGVGQADRIIPACAGFTPGRSRCCSRWGDHPRMRGVYGLPKFGGGVLGGSSPHARGLRSSRYRAFPSPRIIPACAGFTCARPGGPRTPRDHPRMRGVYSATRVLSAQVAGSSPHARGLLCHYLGWVLGLRIIPACAGFTFPATGIIPARAGFTRYARHKDITIRDHPRTRGVYC